VRVCQNDDCTTSNCGTCEKCIWTSTTFVALGKLHFALFPVLDWIAEITTHIPDKREQLVRYYGAYSNASRGKRKKERVEEQPTEVTQVPPPPISRELKRRWPYFIR